MKKTAFLFLCSLLTLASCDNPAKSTAQTNDTTTYSVDGSVQKGPFQLGSAISIQTLNKSLEPTGSVFNTLTSDDFGGFSLHSKIPERYVEIQAKGFYFNECAGTTPSSEITLRTYADLSSTNAVHINVLTAIAHQRIKALVGSGMTFEAAQEKAEKEILDIFGLTAVAGMHFSGYNLESNGSDASLLLAISSTFQQGRSVAALQLFLADLATDLADGSMDNADLVSQIRAGAEAVVPATVIANLQNYYSGRGKTIAVPDFEKARIALRTAGGILSTPIPGKPAGTYMSPLSVTLTAPAGSIIRYATDATTDLKTGGTVYDASNPITLTASGSTPNNVTIRAVAELNGVCSSETTVKYVVREGRLGSDYMDVTPGHFIEYDFSGFLRMNSSTAVMEKAHAVIQPGNSTYPYFVSFTSASDDIASTYLYPARSGYAAGGMGGAIAGPPYVAWFDYEFRVLPQVIYFGYEYQNQGIKFTPSLIASWSNGSGITFTDVIRVDFDSTNFSHSSSTTLSAALHGNGYAIYAKNVGLVYLELTHTDSATGVTNGKTESLTYSTSGIAKLVSFRGSLKVGGSDGAGYTVAPYSFIEDLPGDAFTSITSGSDFAVKQYVAPGSYFMLRFFPTGTTEETMFKVKVPTPLPDVIELGEIGGVGDGGLLTP